MKFEDLISLSMFIKAGGKGNNSHYPSTNKKYSALSQFNVIKVPE